MERNTCETGLTWNSRSRQNTCDEFRWEQCHMSLKSWKDRPWAGIKTFLKNVSSKQTWVVVKSRPGLNTVSILVEHFTRENTYFRRGICCTYVVHVSICKWLDFMLQFDGAVQTWVKPISYKVLSYIRIWQLLSPGNRDRHVVQRDNIIYSASFERSTLKQG